MFASWQINRKGWGCEQKVKIVETKWLHALMSIRMLLFSQWLYLKKTTQNEPVDETRLNLFFFLNA